MAYKALLVEDEIFTREGIRDNIDWNSLGFSLCGEAPDGEIALPMILSCRPDVVITDIKMPFMDGLELTQLVREALPECKIIILSGHDEFEYAQKAVSLGVTEYLLKPISVESLSAALTKIAAQIEANRAEQARLSALAEQAQNNQASQRTAFFIKVLTGGLQTQSAIEQGRTFNVSLAAPFYQVLSIRAGADCNLLSPLRYRDYQHTAELIASLLQDVDDLIFFRKDVEEIVLILMGQDQNHLPERARVLSQLIQQEVQSASACVLNIGIGGVCERITAIPGSYRQALQHSVDQDAAAPPAVAADPANASFLQIDRGAVERFLRHGTKTEFENFFSAYVLPLQDIVLDDRIFLNYVLIDLVLSAVDFVDHLGGELDEDIPEARWVKAMLADIQTPTQLREKVREVLFAALDFRDRRVSNQVAVLLQQARAYVEQNYAAPDISLKRAAEQANLSQSHFSVQFKQAYGENFIGYLTRLRMEKAMELLRTTSLQIGEISRKTGYRDAHYFSTVFKKHAGLTPTQYREQAFKA